MDLVSAKTSNPVGQYTLPPEVNHGYACLIKREKAKFWPVATMHALSFLGVLTMSVFVQGQICLFCPHVDLIKARSHGKMSK